MEDDMHAHGELDYCPNCGREVYPASEPCKACGFPNTKVKIILDAGQLDDLLSNRIHLMRPVIEYIRKNVELLR